MDMNDIKDINDKLQFQFVHMGVNCLDGAEAAQAAQLMQAMFGIPARDGKDSIFSVPGIEWMKGSGRGTHGHIGIGTADIHAARRYLEALGYTFDQDSAKYDEGGNLIVLYLSQQLCGFALHLLQT